MSLSPSVLRPITDLTVLRDHAIVGMLDEGNGARQVLGEADLPVRSVVVGIVDGLG